MKGTFQQLSLFLENKIGNLGEIMEILGEGDIRILASMVADTTEFGIMRLVTSDNDRAFELLRAARKNVTQSEVVAILCDSAADAFAAQLQLLVREGVIIEYMYSFVNGMEVVAIMRVNNPQRVIELAANGEIELLSNEGLSTL